MAFATLGVVAARARTVASRAGRVVPLAEVDAHDRAAWRALADRAVEPNPFHDPDFVLAAARHLDAAGVGLAVVEAASGWEACLPVERVRRLPEGHLPAVRTWRHLYCFLGTPLVAADASSDAFAALLDAIRAWGGPNRLLALEWQGDDGPVGAAAAAAVEEHRLRVLDHQTFTRATIVRGREGEDPVAVTLSGDRRRRLQRLRRRLAEELGGEVVSTDRAGDPAAVEEFLQLEASGWKGNSGTALASRPADAQLFRQVCEAFASRGRLRLRALEAGGRSVAMKCSFVAGDAVFCFKSAYDERHRVCSPGVLLELDDVDAFAAGRERWMDSCTDPENEMINGLWPDRRRLTTLVLAPTGVLGRAAAGALPKVGAVRRRLRSAP